MDTRDKEVLNMQLTLIPILAKAWNKSFSDLSDMFGPRLWDCERMRSQFDKDLFNIGRNIETQKLKKWWLRSFWTGDPYRASVIL